MPAVVLHFILLLLAGVLLNMGLLHFFSFMETRSHPFIARSAMPHLASSLWATLQLSLGLGILLALGYRFAVSLDTLVLFLGFALWGVALGYFYDRNTRRFALLEKGSGRITGKDSGLRER